MIHCKNSSIVCLNNQNMTQDNINERNQINKLLTHLQSITFFDDIDLQHPIRLFLLQIADILGDLYDLKLRHLIQTQF